MSRYQRPRDVVFVTGTDATSFLSGQLSQEIEALEVGATTWSFLLQPQGKVEAFLRVTRAEPDAWVLDVDGGWGSPVATRLARFKLRVKVEIEHGPWRCVAWRHEIPTEEGVPSEPWWPGVDVFGGEGEDGWEVARIEHDIPAMGAELDEKTIPGETGLVGMAVSFTKGCYTGQELVARIDSRGHVNRHLRRIVADGAELPAGASIVSDGKVVGTLTSAAGSVGLGYVRREVEPPAPVSVQWDDAASSAPATVAALPYPPE